MTLRARLSLLIAVSALIVALITAAVAMVSIGRLTGLAQQAAAGAMKYEVEEALLRRAEEQALADDLAMQRVQASAVALAGYISWLYEHPDYFPPHLEGGTPLRATTQGHLVNDRDTAVGVFVPRAARPEAATWAEAGLLSFIDPLLSAVQAGNSTVTRSWVVSASGVVRMFPNQGLGHGNSPIGPDYDYRSAEGYLTATPDRNADQLPVWSRPHRDPASGRLMITASVPVYGGGRFLAVVGLDMELQTIVCQVLAAGSEGDGYAFLVDQAGDVIVAPDEARLDLGLPLVTDHAGDELVVRLGSSPIEEVQALSTAITSGAAPGLMTIESAGGPRYFGYAPLPSTGWLLTWSLPEGSFLGRQLELGAEIDDLQQRFVGGMAGVSGAVALLLAGAGAMAGRWLTGPLGALAAGARRIGGDPGYRLPDLGADEVGQLGREINLMAGSLTSSRAAAVRLAEEAASERQARLIAVFEERNRLAREIHDTIAQGLAGVVLMLDNVGEMLAAGENTAAAATTRTAAELARNSLVDARRSLRELRPAPVLADGLAGALSQLATDHRADGLDVFLELPEEEPRWPAPVEDVLYRVAQEALRNVVQHSRAGAVRVAVRRGVGPEGIPRAIMEISDDGIGFATDLPPAPAVTGGGFGLWVMQQRLTNVGGHLAIDSRPGAGARLRATIPLGDPQGASPPEGEPGDERG